MLLGGRKKPSFVPILDEFTDLQKLKKALQLVGMEPSNLIIGIDFTNCNQNIVKHSVSGGRSHHGRTLKTPSGHFVMNPNPYEHAITIIGKVLIEFDADKKIPCFGFGDASTRDQKVFNFFSDGAPCYGFEDILARYRALLPRIRFSEPISFAPIIYAAIDMVRRSGGCYHILVIITNGQVTCNCPSQGKISSQAKNSIDAIVYASSFPLSIVVVGVGEGPWDTMKQFDDALPKRKFDNFQFVNYTEIIQKYEKQEEIELASALAILMELPQQVKAMKQLTSCRQGRERKAIITPPP